MEHIDQMRPIHGRSTSVVASESDSSVSSPEPLPDEDNEYFMMQINDSQSSIGVPNTRESGIDMDLGRQQRLSPISKLPSELLLSIFARLSTTSDLRSCMLVSYRWAAHVVGILWHRPLCNKVSNLTNAAASLSSGMGFFPYHELVKRLNLSALNDKVSDGTVQAFMHCKRIERLTLTNCSNLTDRGVSILVEGNKHLQALDVTDIKSLTDRMLLTVADSCPRLQGLNLTNCSLITDESLVEVAEHCRHLKRLKLNNVNKATDVSVTSFARNCRSILEIDLHSCSNISSESVTALLANLMHLRELRLSHCSNIRDNAFLDLPPRMVFDSLRILDLTACERIGDDAISRIIPAAPRLRNLVLAKCKHITDRAVLAICRLTKNLHYIHLGHCVNITDGAVIALVKACNRIRYIDLACCYRLTDASVQHLAQLPKLRRIGLVKCQQLTDRSILALARGPLIQAVNGKIASAPVVCSLERVHLSYCVNLTLQGIHVLLNNCPRLTHLSLTGVQAFLRNDLTRFCRDAPPEFTHPQRDVFCVFSGEGVTNLRNRLNQLAMDRPEQDGQEGMEDSVVDGDESAGADTISEDETVGDEGSDETVIRRGRNDIPIVNLPPSMAMESMGAVHVDMPFLPAELMVRMGPRTPSSSTPQRSMSPAPRHFIGSGSAYFHDAEYTYTPRSPRSDEVDGDDGRDWIRNREPHARRHTMESGMDFYGQPTLPAANNGPSSRPPAPAPDHRISWLGSHGMLVPSFLGGGSQRQSWRSTQGQGDTLGIQGPSNDPFSSRQEHPWSGGSHQDSNARGQTWRPLPNYTGPPLPSWGSGSSGQGQGLSPLVQEDVRAAMRSVVEPVSHQQERMEGIEPTHPYIPVLERGQGTRLEDNVRFIQEAVHGRGTAPASDFDFLQRAPGRDDPARDQDFNFMRQ